MALPMLDCICSPFNSLFCSSGCIFVRFKPTQVSPNPENKCYKGEFGRLDQRT